MQLLQSEANSCNPTKVERVRFLCNFCFCFSHIYIYIYIYSPASADRSEGYIGNYIYIYIYMNPDFWIFLKFVNCFCVLWHHMRDGWMIFSASMIEWRDGSIRTIRSSRKISSKGESLHLCCDFVISGWKTTTTTKIWKSPKPVLHRTQEKITREWNPLTPIYIYIYIYMCIYIIIL